jgi:hypothetical protein
MKKIFSLFIFSILLITSSCEDVDKLNPDSIANGAVLTTVEIVSSDIDKGDPASSEINIIVQFNDFMNNDSMEEVDVYVQFVDTTPVDNQVIKLPEVFLRTISASDFATDAETGFPTTGVIVTGAEAISATGVDPADLDGGDLFIVRFVLKLKDGREFSSGNVGEDVAVTSHNAPFRYPATVKCLTPAFDFSGTWSVVTNGTNTDGQPAAVNLPYDVTIAASGASGLDYTISDGVAGVYIFWYTIYGYDFETEGNMTEVCGTKLIGSWKEGFGSTINLEGEIVDADNLIIKWSNGFGDKATAIYTRQ